MCKWVQNIDRGLPKNSNESCTFAIFGQIGFLGSSENLCNFAEGSYFLRVVFSYFHEKKK